MIVLVLLLGLVLFVGWRMAKRHRAGVLAGLDSERPAFQVSPPARGVGKRRTESL